MPNIPEFNTPAALTLRPSEAAASVAREAGIIESRESRLKGESIGRGVSAFGAPIQEMVNNAERHQTFEQISHGAVSYSALFNDLSTQWNTLAAKSDPNDTSIMEGFREKILHPALEKFRAAFEAGTPGAQQWALTRADQLEQHFAERMQADMGTRAGVAVQQNLDDIARNYSNVVVNDPTALSHVEDSVKGDVRAMIASSPMIRPSDAARIEGELVPKIMGNVSKAAVWSAANANPRATIAELEAGKFDKWIDGPTKLQAIKHAETVDKEQRADREHQQEVDARERRRVADQTADSYIQDIMAGKSVGGKVASDPRLDREARTQVVSFQHSYTQQLRERKENEPHPSEYRRLLTDLIDKSRVDPNNLSDRDIDQAFKDRKLNPGEWKDLKAIYAAKDKPFEQNFNTQLRATESAIRNSISGMILQKTDETGSAYSTVINRIYQDAHRKLDAERAKPDGDVNPLLDPTNPKYLFSKATIASYLPTAQQANADAAKIVREREGKIVRKFATEAEAEKAGLQPGTRVEVNGVPGVWK